MFKDEGFKDFIMIYCKLALLFACLLFSACSSMGDVKKIDAIYYQDSNINGAYEYAVKYFNDDFLWAFQSGILGFQTGNFSDSVKFLNISETYFEINAKENIFQSTLKTLATILVSNGMFDYYGNLYEAVFVNYYKALSFMMLGDYASSRVEFNRANDRQRRSKEFFADRINKINEALNNGDGVYGDDMDSIDSEKTFQSMSSIYTSRYKNLDKFRAYSGYVNPMVSYVSGIFFLLQNDFNKANDLLKEAYAISQKEKILDDIHLLNDRKQGKNVDYYTWIFIEDGRSPKKYEMRLDVPLFLLNYGAFYFNIALPQLDSGKLFYSKYYMKSDMKSTDSFELLNMESIIANEFSVELPYIIMTSLVSSTYKVYLQNILSENFGILGAIGGAAFSSASTNADIRNSRILPLRFLAIRIQNEDVPFRLFGDRKLLYSLSFDKECNKLCLFSDNIVYIRVLQNGIISTLTHSIRGGK